MAASRWGGDRWPCSAHGWWVMQGPVSGSRPCSGPDSALGRPPCRLDPLLPAARGHFPSLVTRSGFRERDRGRNTVGRGLCSWGAPGQVQSPHLPLWRLSDPHLLPHYPAAPPLRGRGGGQYHWTVPRAVAGAGISSGMRPGGGRYQELVLGSLRGPGPGMGSRALE